MIFWGLKGCQWTILNLKEFIPFIPAHAKSYDCRSQNVTVAFASGPGGNTWPYICIAYTLSIVKQDFSRCTCHAVVGQRGILSRPLSFVSWLDIRHFAKKRTFISYAWAWLGDNSLVMEIQCKCFQLSLLIFLKSVHSDCALVIPNGVCYGGFLGYLPL